MSAELKREWREHLQRADLIVNRGEAEERGLSETETADVDRHLEAANAIRRQLRSAGVPDGDVAGVPDAVRPLARGEQPPADWSTRGPSARSNGIDPRCPVLSRDQRAVDYLAALGRGKAYERIDDRFCVGELVLASLTGNRDRLSEAEERSLSAGVGVAGGFVLEGQAAGIVIDLLRPATRVLQAGASIVPMQEGTLKLAKITAAGQPGWHVENAADVSESGLQFGALVLVAKTLPVIATCSVELVEDLNSSMLAQAIERELIRSIAQELDRSCLRGTGLTSEHITGLRNKSTVVKTELGPNGLETTNYDWIVDAIGRIWAQNMEPTAWLTSSAVAVRMEKYASSGAGADGQPLRPPRAVENLPRFLTNQIPATLTVGSSTDCSEAYFGNWADMLLGVRSNMRVEATRVAGDAFKKMQVLIRCYLRADMAVAHGESFQVVTGIRD